MAAASPRESALATATPAIVSDPTFHPASRGAAEEEPLPPGPGIGYRPPALGTRSAIAARADGSTYAARPARTSASAISTSASHYGAATCFRPLCLTSSAAALALQPRRCGERVLSASRKPGRPARARDGDRRAPSQETGSSGRWNSTGSVLRPKSSLFFFYFFSCASRPAHRDAPSCGRACDSGS